MKLGIDDEGRYRTLLESGEDHAYEHRESDARLGSGLV